jgi:hypothetical protein
MTAYQHQELGFNWRYVRNRRSRGCGSDRKSAMGHAITISTLYLNKISKENDAITEYSCLAHQLTV